MSGVSISGETTAPLPRLGHAMGVLLNQGFNLRRDHRSLATPDVLAPCPKNLGFQSQARPPLPCHAVGSYIVSQMRRGFNLRRDHRSLATQWLQGEHVALIGFNLRRDHRSLATFLRRDPMSTAFKFQSQARPPLPCHSDKQSLRVYKVFVSISGETTAPLPLCIRPLSALEWCCFNLRRDHRSLATSLCHTCNHILMAVSISGETTAPLPRPLAPEICSLLHSFNLRRDHRSLATLHKISGAIPACGFQSQARPPLPCHYSYILDKVSFDQFQSQARPPLPCHGRGPGQ